MQNILRIKMKLREALRIENYYTNRAQALDKITQ